MRLLPSEKAKSKIKEPIVLSLLSFGLENHQLVRVVRKVELVVHVVIVIVFTCALLLIDLVVLKFIVQLFLMQLDVFSMVDFN